MIWLQDVGQAFIHLKPLTHSAFTKAPNKAKINEDKVLHLMLRHRSLVALRLCFFEASYPVFGDILKMSSFASNLCFLFKTYDTNFLTTTGLATDDFFITSNAKYPADEGMDTKSINTRKSDVLLLHFQSFLIEHKKKLLTCISFLAHQSAALTKLQKH